MQREIPGPQPEHIGNIDPIREPWLEGQQQKLQTFVSGSGELQARIGSIKNPHLTQEQVQYMVDSWNREHGQAWAGGYVEEKFDGANGIKLTIRMDRNGNVRLGYKYEQK